LRVCREARVGGWAVVGKHQSERASVQCGEPRA
jgi:hypothetical protein